MRHIWLRGIAGILWLAAAIVNALSGLAGAALLYAALSAVFLHSAYSLWKQYRQNKGGR